jgi:hypothetical protein
MKHDHETLPIVPWLCAVVGGAITLYGLHGLIRALHGITSRQFLQWFVGADLAHDLIVAPAACVIGAGLARLVPAPARAHVRAGLFATAVVVAIAWAPLHGYGHDSAPGNTSVQPLDYSTAVPTVLVAVWALAAGWFAVSFVRRTGRPRPVDRLDRGE